MRINWVALKKVLKNNVMPLVFIIISILSYFCMKWFFIIVCSSIETPTYHQILFNVDILKRALFIVSTATSQTFKESFNFIHWYHWSWCRHICGWRRCSRVWRGFSWCQKVDCQSCRTLCWKDHWVASSCCQNGICCFVCCTCVISRMNWRIRAVWG